MNAFIRLLYAVVIAGAFVAFVGLGIYSFYQPPKNPDYPSYTDSSQAQYDQQQTTYNKQLDAYNKKDKHYYHNVTLVALPVAVVITVGGVILLKSRRFEVIGEGIALGGVATSIYAIIVSSLADANKLRFVAAAILLIAIVVIAHLRFSTNHTSTTRTLV